MQVGAELGTCKDIDEWIQHGSHFGKHGGKSVRPERHYVIHGQHRDYSIWRPDDRVEKRHYEAHLKTDLESKIV